MNKNALGFPSLYVEILLVYASTINASHVALKFVSILRMRVLYCGL